jgi:Fe-S cluster assembly scaffold protein SufB
VNTDDKPESFGVFKPVGHVIVAFASEADAEAAQTQLRREAFTAEDIRAYTPEQMKNQADIDIEQAGVLASIGQELNLVKAHRELAAQGYSFLVVKAPNDDATQRVAEIARRCHAARAQKYGRLIIEELIEVGTGDKQVAESSDRGLDSQTVSGREGADGR